MKQISLGNLSVTITADDTAFIVDIGSECFAETYMDGQPCRWPNPADGKMWSYIKGPAANVRIPVPYPGKHELGLLIGGRLFKSEHDFPDLYAEPEIQDEPAEQPAGEPEKTIPVRVDVLRGLFGQLMDAAACVEALLAQEDK